MKIEEMKKSFTEKFGSGEEPQVFFAPGRVNLIGEHTDYNGGHVFPCALTLGTYGLARRRGDGSLNLYSENFSEEGVLTYSVKNLDASGDGAWTDYPRGVIWAFEKKGYPIDCGMDIYFYGTSRLPRPSKY